MNAEGKLAKRLARLAIAEVNMLADGGYEVVAAGSGGHVSEEELRRAVEDYGQRLVAIPQAELEALDYRRVPGEEPATYEVSVPLWTEEGPSDLVLELRFVEAHKETFDVEVLALHVVPGVRRRRHPRAHAEAPPRPAPSRGAPVPRGTPIPERWRPLFAEIVHRLVIGDYAGLARDGFVAGTDDPSDESIGIWIEQYRGTLADLPEEAWAFSDHVRVEHLPDTWRVLLDLWDEDGPSDLSLEAVVRDDGSTIEIKVENVHMM